MKKFLIIILLFSAVTGVHAQRFRWGLSTDFSSDTFRVVRPIGDAATQYFIIDGVKVPNTGTNLLPVNNFLAEPPNLSGGVWAMGRGAYTSGSTAFGFNASDRSWTRHNVIRFTMNGSGESLQWRARINLENLVQPHHSASSMVTGDGRPGNFENLLFLRQLDEWWIRGRAGVFTAWLGNAEAGSGVTSAGRFQDFSDWTRGVKIDGFGIMIPASVENPATLNDGSEHNSFLRMWRLSSHPGNPPTGAHDRDTPVVLIMSARFLNLLDFPLTVDLGFDPGRNTGHGNTNPRNALTANGAIRISGQAVLDNLFNFDLIYQFRGFDPNTLENVVMDENGDPLPGWGSNQPDGRGEFVHTVGGYFHFISPLPSLGVSVGYSALFRTFEDNATTWVDGNWRNVQTITPLFHGIDLRMRYTGIQNLRITFNNNVSFANARPGTWTGGADAGAYQSVRAMGLAGVNPMLTSYDRQESQSWFGFYNALLIRYTFTPLLNLSFEAANRWGKTTQRWNYREENPIDVLSIERTRHDLIASLYATFRFSARITMEAGLSARMLNHTWERNFRGEAPEVTHLNDTTIADVLYFGRHSWDSGFYGISMPLRMRVSF